jgi:hypothetical protein
MKLFNFLMWVLGRICWLISGFIVALVILSTVQHPEKGIPRSPKLLLFGVALMALSYILMLPRNPPALRPRG